jgi:hypothetical protein
MGAAHMLHMREPIYFHLCFGSGALRRRTPTNGDVIGAKFALQELPSFTLIRVMLEPNFTSPELMFHSTENRRRQS